ncbi:spore germination protein [Niallia sp. 01092]|uniref:spore germination protein n=1 Tax=unclassified Niallia TaxID=2837522 RepID=UPI003FD39882
MIGLFRKSPKNRQVKIPNEIKNIEILSMNLDENVKELQSIFETSFDIVFHSFVLANDIKAIVIYIEGLVNTELLEQHVLTPLLTKIAEQQETLEDSIEDTLQVAKKKEIKTIKACVENILIGNPVLLIHTLNKGYSLGLTRWEQRSIEEPQSESLVRGPREGFIESLGVNLSLIRRKVKSPLLKTESMTIGKYTSTNIAIAYIKGIAEEGLLEEVKSRLNQIEIDSVLESGYIEELIEDNSYSPFPQILNTERPDVVAAHLLEGRVAILVDGTPFVLIAPISFFSLLQSSEDYYQRFFISSVIRILRFTFMMISLLLPSLYIAVVTYHQEMIPTNLLISIAAARESVPFPAFIEAFLMEITFEALREAGVRLPKQIGSAVSIVGALVIGQAAVQAGLVSAPMVIVVALTGIASFMIPYYSQGISLRLLRFPMMILASTLGLLGIMLGIIAIIIHLCALRSFGVPYLTPIAPLKGKELKDSFIRAPWWKMNTRPHLTGHYNKYRQNGGQKPGPQRK